MARTRTLALPTTEMMRTNTYFPYFWLSIDKLNKHELRFTHSDPVVDSLWKHPQASYLCRQRFGHPVHVDREGPRPHLMSTISRAIHFCRTTRSWRTSTHTCTDILSIRQQTNARTRTKINSSDQNRSEHCRSRHHVSTARSKEGDALYPEHRSKKQAAWRH